MTFCYNKCISQQAKAQRPNEGSLQFVKKHVTIIYTAINCIVKSPVFCHIEASLIDNPGNTLAITDFLDILFGNWANNITFNTVANI